MVSTVVVELHAPPAPPHALRSCDTTAPDTSTSSIGIVADHGGGAAALPSRPHLETGTSWRRSAGLHQLQPSQVHVEAAMKTMHRRSLRFIDTAVEAQYHLHHVQTNKGKLLFRMGIGIFWCVVFTAAILPLLLQSPAPNVGTSILAAISAVWYPFMFIAVKFMPIPWLQKSWDVFSVGVSVGYIVPVFLMLLVCVKENLAPTMERCMPVYDGAAPTFLAVLAMSSPHFVVPVSGGTWYVATIVAFLDLLTVPLCLLFSDEPLPLVVSLAIMCFINVPASAANSYSGERMRRTSYWLSIVNQSGAEALAETEDLRRGTAIRNDAFMTFAQASGQIVYELDDADCFQAVAGAPLDLLGVQASAMLQKSHNASVYDEDSEMVTRAIRLLRHQMFFDSQSGTAGTSSSTPTAHAAEAPVAPVPAASPPSPAPLVLQFRRYHADGHVLWVEMVAVFSGAVLMASERNVGAERDAREAIIVERQRRVAASAAQAAHEETLGYACHELRNPLHVIQASISLLGDTQLQPEQHEHLSSIKEASNQMHTLVDDILDVERLRAGKLQIESIPSNPQLVVQRLVLQHRDFARVTIEADIHPDTPVNVVMPHDRVVQILNNGMTNAAKFCSAGVIRVRVMPGVRPRTLRFEVRNSGVLPDRALFRAFESTSTPTASASAAAGFHGSYGRTSSGAAAGSAGGAAAPGAPVKGTGLGLRISASLATAIGGELNLENLPILQPHPDVPDAVTETVFSLELPYQVDNGGPPPDHGGAAAPTSVMLRTPPSSDLGLHVLYVDDEPLNRRLGQVMLHRLGCTCELLEDGDQVMAHNPESFDVILLDIVMQRMRGDELIRELIAAGVRTPCIAVSGNTDQASVQSYLRLGFRETMGKPFTLEQMRQVLAPLAQQRVAAPVPGGTF